MAQQTLRDKNFRVIGYIDTDSSGKQKISDKNFRTLGHYDPRTNKTTDKDFRTVGQGNLLTSLLSN